MKKVIIALGLALSVSGAVYAAGKYGSNRRS